MKRYILKLALLTLSMGALISCEEDTVTYGGNNFVSLENVASGRLNFFENRGIAEIPVNLAFPKSNDVTVSFTITSTVAVEGVHYNVLTPNSITIPAGATSANIRIEVINNEILNDSKALNITFTDISDSSVALGLQDAGSKAKRFLIVNDDCTTNFLELYGDYDAYNGDNEFIGTAFVDVTEEGECNTILVSGVIESVLTNQTDSPIRFTLNPGPGSNGANVGTLSAFEQLYCEDCYTDPDGIEQTVLYKGGGSFNISATTQTINITGTLAFASNSGTPIANTNVRLVRK